jgi:hypothetical protein
LPQLEINPYRRGRLVHGPPISKIPEHIREFGYIPDFSQCLPGDLVLFRDPNRSLTGYFVTRAQRQFANSHARWTHAAVFLYDDLIVEAVPNGGVRTRSLYDDIPNRILRVRRDESITEIDRYRIALRAQSMLGNRYSFRAAISIGWNSRNGILHGFGSPSLGRVIICSRVFHDAYAEITEKLLDGCILTGPITPAHLSATRDLNDVRVGWIRVRDHE